MKQANEYITRIHMLMMYIIMHIVTSHANKVLKFKCMQTYNHYQQFETPLRFDQ